LLGLEGVQGEVQKDPSKEASPNQLSKEQCKGPLGKEWYSISNSVLQ